AEVEHALGAAVALHARQQVPAVVVPVGAELGAGARCGVGDGVAFLDPEQDVARVQRGQLRRRGDDVLQLGLRVTPRAGEQQLAAGELVAPVAHQLRAAGAGVGGVDEELRALDPGDVEVVVDEIGQRLAGDRLGQGGATTSSPASTATGCRWTA